FFDNQFREIEGDAGITRDEVGAQLKIGWALPLSPRLRVIVSAGPSYVNVRQTLVTGVQYAEEYPYDTAAFTSAITRHASRGAAGVSAGADAFWMFRARLGAGALVQISRARVNMPADGRTVSVNAGGAQIGAGVRLLF